MSSLSLIEATSQKVIIRLERGFKLKENLGIFFLVVFWLSLGFLLMSTLASDLININSPTIVSLTTASIGLFLITIAVSIVINFFANNAGNIKVFIFDKSDDKIWLENHSSKRLITRNLLGNLAKFRAVTLKERNEANGAPNDFVVGFSIYFIQDSGSSIILYGETFHGTGNQLEREHFNEKLENARTIVRSLNDFLNSNAT
jgi:hypothetical protein